MSIRENRYTVRAKEGQPPMTLETRDAFIEWMTKHSTDNCIITPLYDTFDKAMGVLASQWCKGQKQFLVQWAPTPCRVRHIPLHVERGYKVHSTAPYAGDQLQDTEEDICLVTWEPKWEAADSFCHADHPEQIALAAEFAAECDGLDTIKMARKNHRRQDAHKSNLEKQGTWVERERRTQIPLAYKTIRRRYIHIDPNDTINPDQDIITDGTYTLGPVTNTMTKEGSLVNVYDDVGKVISTITEKRLAILHSGYCHTKQLTPELMHELHAASFVQEVAKLALRYQVGCNDTLQSMTKDD